MKKIMVSLLISFFCVFQLTGRWIALKNSTEKPISLKLSSHAKLTRKPEHRALMIEPQGIETVAVFSKKRGAQDKYLTNFEISWQDGTKPWKTKGFDLERTNRYIASLSDNASKDNPEGHAIAIRYDSERQQSSDGSWIKNPRLDFFEVQLLGQRADTAEAERLKKGAKKTGEWLKEKVLRIPPKKRP